MGINIHEVIAAAATKPLGFVAYQPGPGLGRALHCHRPVLPDLWKAREYGHQHPLYRAGRSDQPPHAALGSGQSDGRTQRPGQGAQRQPHLVLGLAYKKKHRRHARIARRGNHWTCCKPRAHTSTTATRTSPATFPRKRDFHFDLQSVALTPEDSPATTAWCWPPTTTWVDLQLLRPTPGWW